MADVNSIQYGNAVAKPVVQNETGVASGRIRRAVAVATVADNSPDTSEKINLFKLPRNAMIQDIWVGNDGSAITTLVLDIGEDVSGKTDLLMDGADMTSSAKSLKASEAEQGTNGYNPMGADADAPLWEILGYTAASDAPQEIVIAATAATASGGAGVVVVVISYVVD
jgi:hypothetical protein